MAKKILFLSFSVFLIYQTYNLMKALLLNVPGEMNIRETIFISFLLNLYITGVFAFPGFVFPTNRLLKSSYYKIKNTKYLLKIYKYIGVDVYRSGLLIVFWGRSKNRLKYFNGTRSGLQNFIYQSKQSEFGHLSAFVLILLMSIILFFYGYIQLGIITILINIFGNFYPLILQRYHRIRIERIIN